MSDLEFSGGVDLSEAVTSIDAFATDAASRFEEMLVGFAGDLAGVLANPEPIQIEADASSIPVEVESAVSGLDTQVQVDADTTLAAAAASDLVGAIDAESASITIDADTTEAAAALDDLSGSLSGAGSAAAGSQGAVEGWGESAAVAGGAAALARGEVGGLGEVVTGTGLAAAATVGGVAALGVSVFELAQKGIEATSAEQRFTQALGEQAEAVENVQVGSLSADLAELGLQFGSTDADMQNATASVFQFAVNSGASREEAAKFTTEIAGLSARAVATKPSVGDLDDVMTRAAIGIGRTRTAAQLLNIGLSTTEVATRAATVAQQAGRSEVTAYDKSVAAAQISVERFGDTLGTTVAEGAKNAANEQKSLKAELSEMLEQIGKPLVAPLFDAIRESLPDVVAIAAPLGELGVAVLPAIAAAAAVAAPPLQLIADAIESVPEPALTAGAAIVVLAVAVDALTVSETAGVASAGLFAAAQTALAADVTLASVSMSTAIPVVGAFIAGYAGTMAVAHALGIETKSYADLTKTELTYAQHVATLSGKALRDGFQELITKADEASDGSIGPLAIKLLAFRDIAEANIVTAEQLAGSTDHNTYLYRGMIGVLRSVQAASHEATDTTGLDAYNAAVDTGVASLDDYAAALHNVATQQESAFATQLSAEKAQNAANDAIEAEAKALNDAAAAGFNDEDANKALRDASIATREAIVASADATDKQVTAVYGAAAGAAAHRQALIDLNATTTGPTHDAIQGLIDSLDKVKSPPPIVITADVSAALAAIATIEPALANTLAAETPEQRAATLEGIVYGSLGAEGAYVPASAGGSPWIVGEAGVDEVIVSPRDLPSAAANLQHLGVLDELFAQSVYTQGGTIYPQGAWSGGSGGSTRTGGGGEIRIDKVVLEQASTNPTREVMKAMRQLGRAATMAKL